MDKNEALKIAIRYVKAVSRKYRIESAFLFGSFAKNTFHKDSDIDIAIVFRQVDDIIDRQAELLQLRTDDDLMIEPHPFAMDNFNFSDPKASEILRYGQQL